MCKLETFKALHNLLSKKTMTVNEFDPRGPGEGHSGLPPGRWLRSQLVREYALEKINVLLFLLESSARTRFTRLGNLGTAFGQAWLV